MLRLLCSPWDFLVLFPGIVGLELDVKSVGWGALALALVCCLHSSLRPKILPPRLAPYAAVRPLDAARDLSAREHAGTVQKVTPKLWRTANSREGTRIEGDQRRALPGGRGGQGNSAARHAMEFPLGVHSQSLTSLTLGKRRKRGGKGANAHSLDYGKSSPFGCFLKSSGARSCVSRKTPGGRALEFEPSLG